MVANLCEPDTRFVRLVRLAATDVEHLRVYDIFRVVHHAHERLDDVSFGQFTLWLIRNLPTGLHRIELRKSLQEIQQ